MTEQGFTRELLEDPLQAVKLPADIEMGMYLGIHLPLFLDDSETYGYLNQAFSNVFDRQAT